MTSEWMKVMLEEIERKRIDAEQARLEDDRRTREPGPGAEGATAAPPAADPVKG